MATYVYLIRTITNLHAGSGDAGYGAVDKLVQRDAATGIPTIHASGIKGALREFCGEAWVETERIFGSANNAQERATGNIKQGAYRFFGADLLALPEPVHQDKGFQLTGSNAIADVIAEKLNRLGAPGPFNLHTRFEINNSTAFFELHKELPVIARNSLENGVSTNLWYEEVVPRESLFVTCIIAPDNQLDLKINNQVIQLGGNATVGYGFCLFTQIAG